MKANMSSKAVNQMWMEFLSDSCQKEERRCFTGDGDLGHDSLLILQDVQWPLKQDSTGKEEKKKPLRSQFSQSSEMLRYSSAERLLKRKTHHDVGG